MSMRGGMARRACWALIAWKSLAGCSAFDHARPAANGGTLQVQIVDLTTSGHAAKIIGTVSNKSTERVEGVRYLVTVRDKNDPSKILSRYDRQVDTAIDPGGQAAVRLDVEGAQFGSKSIRVAIAATPVTLGGQAVAAPEGWTGK